MDEKRKELIDGLFSVLLFLSFNCYSEKKEEQERVLQLAKNVRNAMDYLEGRSE